MPSAAEALADAQAALVAGDWAVARARFEALEDAGDNAQALAGLGEALWWLGETESAVACHAEAYALFRAAGAEAPAAMSAVALYLLHRASLGNVAVARGWLERAARLVERHRLEPLRGWVCLIRAHAAGDPDEAAGQAEAAREIAVRFGDVDLELCALSQRGAALVEQGSVEEGTALLDESMAAALAGECARLNTVVFTSCNLISSCAHTGSYDRAQEWFRAAHAFTRRYGSPHLYTHCRIYEGALLVAGGDWVGGDRALRSAIRMATGGEPALCGEALARLSDLRIAQGRLAEAARLLDGLEDRATSAVPLALLAAAQEDKARAVAILRRRLQELRAHDERRTDSYRAGAAASTEVAILLETLAAWLTGEEARILVDELSGLARRTRSPLILARASRARGRLRDDPAELEHALGLFARLGMPLEAGRTRMLLARVLGPARAVGEAQAALRAFDGLGATRDADAAAALLRQMGQRPTRRDIPGDGTLSGREREVLRLLGEGLSNREIAERLFLSRKTVEHHVRNVLSKLGLRNRTEAAAYVLRQPGAECAGE